MLSLKQSVHLIIYGGSCANVALFRMVEQLNLQDMTHPNSYNI